MNLKHIVAIAVIITGSVFAQNTPQVDKSNNIIVKAGIAYGFRFGPAFAGTAEQKQVYNNLSAGTVYDFGLFYRINNQAALGFKYNRYNASSPVSDPLTPLIKNTATQNDVISFYGASYLIDQKFRESKHEAYLELAVGYIDYRSSVSKFNNFQSYGGNYGAIANASYKYRLLSKFSVGPTISLIGGVIKNFEITADNISSQTTLDSNTSLWRIDLGFEAIYRL